MSQSKLMRLTLMRHAQADAELPGSRDWERPLTRRGELDAREMARRLKGAYVAPQLILGSPAARARKTAELVAKCFLKAPLSFVEELYLAKPSVMLSVLQQHGALVTHLLLVGHNPGISELANELSSERSIDGMPTASFVSMEFDVSPWQAVLPATGINVDFDYPQRPA